MTVSLVVVLMLLAVATLGSAATADQGVDLKAGKVTFHFHPWSKNSTSTVQDVHSILRARMEEVRQIIRYGRPSSEIPVLDPYRLDHPVQVLLSDQVGFANATLSKTVVEGLSSFEVQDVASNPEILSLSILLRVPELRIQGAYKFKGYLNPPFSQNMHDSGQFDAIARDVRITWSADGLQATGDQVGASRTIIRMSLGQVNHTFWSDSSKTEVGGELRQAISAALLDKVKATVEDALDKSASEVVRKPSGWHAWPKINLASSVRRRKRQLPCTMGPETDEYVDTLFRFAARLLRSIEPIPIPNITVTIEDPIPLMVFVYGGSGSGITNLVRLSSASVQCRNASNGDMVQTLALVVGITEFTGSARYRVLPDYRTLLFNGEVEFRIRNPEVQVQISQYTEPDGDARLTLDVLRIFSLGKVEIIMKGLGNLTRAVGLLLTQTINENPEAVIGVAEGQLKDMLNTMLGNFNIPLFNLV